MNGVRGVLSRIFGRQSPAPSSVPEASRAAPTPTPEPKGDAHKRELRPGRRPPAWTPAEDARILATELAPVAQRTKLKGETELQRLSRELGRSATAIHSRRARLAKRPDREAAAKREREARKGRDREIVAMVQSGASVKEAGHRAGVSTLFAFKVSRRDAPELNLRAKDRGYERRTARARIARELAPRVLDAARAGDGLTLAPAEVAALAAAPDDGAALRDGLAGKPAQLGG